MRKKKEIENAITGKYKSFHPGKVWLDTNGNPIQAHGFSVFYNAEDKTYYWYGENKEKTVGGLFNKIWHWGVRCYVSKDLYNWEDKGLLIHTAAYQKTLTALFTPHTAWIVLISSIVKKQENMWHG